MKELDELNPYEELFYQAAIGKYYESIFEIINTVVVMYLGDEKAQKKLLDQSKNKHVKIQNE